MSRAAGSTLNQSPITFREAQHRLAAQKGMTLGQASSALGGRGSTIGSTMPPASTGIKAPGMRVSTGIFKPPMGGRAGRF